MLHAELLGVTPHRETHTVPQCTHDITKPYPQILNMQTIRTERRTPAPENIRAGVAATLDNDQFMGVVKKKKKKKRITESFCDDSRVPCQEIQDIRAHFKQKKHTYSHADTGQGRCLNMCCPNDDSILNSMVILL